VFLHYFSAGGSEFFPPQAPRESIYGGRYFMHSLYTLWQVDSAAAEHHPFYEHVFINAANRTRERVLNLMRAHLAQLCMKYKQVHAKLEADAPLGCAYKHDYLSQFGLFGRTPSDYLCARWPLANGHAGERLMPNLW